MKDKLKGNVAIVSCLVPLLQQTYFTGTQDNSLRQLENMRLMILLCQYLQTHQGEVSAGFLTLVVGMVCNGKLISDKSEVSLLSKLTNS